MQFIYVGFFFFSAWKTPGIYSCTSTMFKKVSKCFWIIHSCLFNPKKFTNLVCLTHYICNFLIVKNTSSLQKTNIWLSFVFMTVWSSILLFCSYHLLLSLLHKAYGRGHFHPPQDAVHLAKTVQVLYMLSTHSPKYSMWSPKRCLLQKNIFNIAFAKTLPALVVQKTLVKNKNIFQKT